MFTPLDYKISINPPSNHYTLLKLRKTFDIMTLNLGIILYTFPSIYLDRYTLSHTARH
jgi:hypothetical protein